MKRYGLIGALIVAGLLSAALVAYGRQATPDSTVVYITAIEDDLELNDGRTYMITKDLNNVEANIILRGNTTLILRNARLKFELEDDLEHGIYLYDRATLVLENARITSNRKMYEIELRDRATLRAINATLRNHSAIKLFDDSYLYGRSSRLEELRMDHRGIAELDDCDIYPNMQFFFSPETSIMFPPPYTKVPRFTLHHPGAWRLDLTNTQAQGWQVDLYPGTQLTVHDSAHVNLGLRSNGQMESSLRLRNPRGERVTFRLTEFGFDLNIINSEIYFFNLYLRGDDTVRVVGEPGRTTFLEIVLLERARLTIEHSHLMAQLAHANGQSELTIRHSVIGSNDPDDPIRSELAIKDNARGLIEHSNATNVDLVVRDSGQLSLRNTPFDRSRLRVRGDGRFTLIE
jgi:hypothetical protein